MRNFFDHLWAATNPEALKWSWDYYVNFFLENKAVFLTLLLVTFLISAVTLLIRKWKNKDLIPAEVKEVLGVGGRPRFRKRDKVLFYGRKMLRKVTSISRQVHTQGKRKKLIKFAGRWLQFKRDTAPTQLKVLEPPSEYLEEAVTSGQDEQRVPLDALYILQSIRVFGHFEKPVFLTLCKHVDVVNLHAGSYLFKIGDPDENVYVVQNGLINVYITGGDGSTLTLKYVKKGESVTSLLSFVDVLTGHPSPYKTVSARAVEDSTVLRLPVSAFQEVFQEYPETFIRVIQVIMVRLQRVTFTALHQHLGLSAELVNPGMHHQKRKTSPFVTSPVKNRQRDSIVMRDDQDESEAASSYYNNNDAYPSSQPLPILRQRLSKTSITSISSHTPDMVPDLDPSISPQPPDLQQGMPRRRTVPELCDEDTLIQIATAAFVRELGLEDSKVLDGGKVELRDVSAGTHLMKEDSHKDVALIYVISGTLTVSQKSAVNPQIDDEVHMFTAHQGEVVGGLAVLTGEPSFFTIKAKHFTRIALLSKSTFYSIMRERPKVVLHVAHTVVRRLSPFVRQVDFALDWVFPESGRALYRQGNESDCTYIVLSGRLRSVITHANGKKELVGEYGKGDLVGIVEMVTKTKRSTTVMAVRDTELAKLPEGLFNAIKLRYPIVVTRLINLLGHRILGSWQKPTIGRAIDTRPTQVNLSTVAIVGISDDVPLSSFTYELFHALSAISNVFDFPKDPFNTHSGQCLRLTSEVIRKSLGMSILDPNNEYRLTSWLAQQEDQHRIVLYQCDNTMTAWSQRCVRQADCVVIVGLFERGPAVGKMEKEVERLGMRTQKELVLLHKEGSSKPKNTVEWLNNRTWVSQHHHLICPKRMFSKRSQSQIAELYSRIMVTPPDIHSDFSRLARWLTGTSVGLVLGGGGARGAAHVGMIKAIQESGIPIDMVGGVSIGAFMGGLWCLERDMVTMTQKAREWSKKMTSWFKQLLDLTYPATSMFTGGGFNETIKGTFGETLIEDLWIPYFTVTTDTSASAPRIHTHGLFWRYCRASMSVAGIFPPVCDPIDGHLLLDGCYVNNVPADVMRSQGAKHILAIDVGSQDDKDLTNYGDTLSGWWLLWKRWNPFTSPVKVPNLPDIQSRLAYVSCVRQLEEVKTSDYCEYIRPPIDRYKTLQFGSFDEIKDVGYLCGKTYFAGLLKTGSNLPFTGNRAEEVASCSLSAVLSSRNYNKKIMPEASPHYTFTDLAQMVCKEPKYEDEESSSDDYYEDDDDTDQEAQVGGYVSEPTVGTSMKQSRGKGYSLSDNELDGEESETEYRRMD
ncbi:neuropathy target esterase sws isoform X2 [Neocloeon triangulifer]|uniref:neuropathy target esterase sws isoform X2 n=1 Tax=Neocloeon triangulifer TaxID=2078957 RepID=UPI00286F123C|nr:neuropathy target esterase sws isoform X2 [Neocloeon triangulifer]